MSHHSENKYLKSLLEHLITTYETEINYTPLEIELDSKLISKEDITTLLNFVNEARKRLFIFKIPDNEPASDELALNARRSVLNKTANKILQSTSIEPKIYPLKKALSTNSSSVRARIQIQKSFVLPKLQNIKKDIDPEQTEHVIIPVLNLIPVDLPEFPQLMKQLKGLDIEYLHDAALLKIKEYEYVFKDGIIPGNLPKGFYINKEKKALCYSDTPRRLPSALAPVLKKQGRFTLPSPEQITNLLPNLPQSTIQLLLDNHYSLAQRNALSSLLLPHEDEFKSLLQSLKSAELIIPLLCKQFILGGEAHTILLIRLLKACLNKKISLEFLNSPQVQNSLLNPRGIKNLQKLISLPAEQKDWWNKLVVAHLNYDKNSFDFNEFFESYTQIFLSRIAEKNLTLPNPCPIEHNGHLLITLNRVLDVIEQAQNPQEQCLSLSQLNWGPTGVHYAMVQKSDQEKLKQVTSCMHLENPEDTITDPELIYKDIENELIQLKPWLFRYMGQHWKSQIRLSNIQAQLFEIEKQNSWTSVQKNQLIFILTCTFADPTEITSEQWKKNLDETISLLQSLNENHRSDILHELSRCFKFKPTPSFTQIKTLINQCIELKDTFPFKNFKEDLISPIVSLLENEGFELLNCLQERIQKTDPNPQENQFSHSIIASFPGLLQKNRNDLSPNHIKLLAKLNEPELTQIHINEIIDAFKNVQTKKGDVFSTLVQSTLSQINISKSQTLPNVEQIKSLLNTLADTTDNLHEEYKTSESQESWLKNQIIDKNLLAGCVLGNGDISKLDDLIVDALVDAVKKRSAVFKIDTLKSALLENLNVFIVPQQLREQLNRDLIPLFDAINDLVNLLQSPHPKFPEVIEKLQFFEKTKPGLLEGMFSVSILGTTKGEYILNFLLTGKRNPSDNITGSAFATVLGKLHGLFVSQMKAFFDNPQNKGIVKDLDLNTSLSWLTAFNNTHSLTFFFKEELIQKKVLPALKKTLQQLNTQDSDFENSILDEAAIISEDEPSDQALQQYKNKIESIANYLNLLIDIHGKLPRQFNKIYKQLSTGALARLNYSQKHILVNKLIHDKSEKLDLYLKLTTQALEENLNADNKAIERAINGLVELFKLTDLEPETQVMFFKMSMTHNLKSTSPFPLAALNELKKSNLPKNTKSLIIKQIIQIITNLSGLGSAELVQGLVQQTQLFLSDNQNLADLSISLLKRVSSENPNQDLSAYPLILQQLGSISLENRGKIATILIDLANSKKDDSVNLFALLEIAKGLGRRSTEDIDQVLKLFAMPPFPNTQSLNSALLAHDSEKLRAYCLNFDKNPFAKTGEKRNLVKQFATDRIKEALSSLQDMIQEADFPYSLQMKLAKQLTYIETIGYTDPLNPNDFKNLKKLTAYSRHDLKIHASMLLQQLRSKSIAAEQIEATYLELLAYLREIYFRTTGLFPNTTQILILLLAIHDPTSNLLMRIKTGEGKSINTPMLSVIQWTQGGTVDQCTANPTLLIRDFENNCEPFFKFLEIKSALIQNHSTPETYQLDGINCSTVEDMSIFRLAAKEAKKENLLENQGPIHVVLDECDDALLDQITLYKLVAETDTSSNSESNPAQWIYPLAHRFINLKTFRNLDPSSSKVWDEEEDLEQFRLFLNKEINDKFNGNIEKQNYLMASSNTQLKQWIHASCIAATLIENKHYIVQPLKEKDEADHEVTKKIICVPLIRSTPKTGSIFTEAVQQALQARLKAERKDQAHYFFIDAVPSVLSSQSARGLIKFYQNTKGRLLGISATPGDKRELESLETSLGTQAISIAPYAGDKRKNHSPIFTSNREETIQAIHHTLDKVKCPITQPTMKVNPDIAIQTYEEREELIAQTKSAIVEWSHTQTQPILIINEDFNEAQILGASLQSYKKQGFKIQIITGKESPNELDRIIKQAGRVNTITVGTAMLAKGIDINTGDHPRGLFVIQTYPDTERMTTQIAGRAARNGKPGEWLPIYQINKSHNLIDRFFHYFFPWKGQNINELSVESLKSKIKLQATIDRLYTQAIDEVQQIVMQQIEAWENLLLELFPTDQFELYQWRENLLGELTRSQETNVSEATLSASINQFKNLACKLWESAREEQWISKAHKATQMSTEQHLRLKYLKQLDLAEELNIQIPLLQKNSPFISGTKALMRQNIETIIMDKAGAVLDYTKPTGTLKNNLTLAQSKQILPCLIGEFCGVSPDAINTFLPKNSRFNSAFLPEVVSNVVNKLIEQKNRILHYEEQQQITESIIQYYQKELIEADTNKIHDLLSKIKPLIFAYCNNISKSSLVNQFKMQGLILTFCNIYQNLNLPEDLNLNKLKSSYNENIMKKLAKHLLEEFDWVKETPAPLHAFFERSIAKEAAFAIYELAQDLINNPQDKDKIQALYSGLQEHKASLKDKYLFSIHHSSPRKVINDALNAIDSLGITPSCDLDFRNQCHDNAISQYQLNEFRKHLANISPYFFKTNDPTWNHLKNTLLQISQQNQKSQTHVVQELYEATERFSTYNAYKPYLRQINSLKEKLLHSINQLNKPDGLKQDAKESLFNEKTKQFANLLKISPKQVHIQRGSDGINSFIELQIDDAPLKEQFTGYQSSFLTRVEVEKTEIKKIKLAFEENKNALLELSNIELIESLPTTKRTEFEKLFRLKKLLGQDWSLNIQRDDLPESIMKQLKQIDGLQHADWTSQAIDLSQLKLVLGKEPDEHFMEMIEKQATIMNDLEKIRGRVKDAQEQVRIQQQEISNIENNIQVAQLRRQHSDCGYTESGKLLAQIFFYQSKIRYLQSRLEQPTQSLIDVQEEETKAQKMLAEHNQFLDEKRKDFTSNQLAQVKQELSTYLQNTCKQRVNELENELQKMEPAIENLEKIELKKSRYQTRRFFKTSELLNYEAYLAGEEALIPKKHENPFSNPEPFELNGVDNEQNKQKISFAN